MLKRKNKKPQHLSFVWFYFITFLKRCPGLFGNLNDDWALGHGSTGMKNYLLSLQSKTNSYKALALICDGAECRDTQRQPKSRRKSSAVIIPLLIHFAYRQCFYHKAAPYQYCCIISRTRASTYLPCGICIPLRSPRPCVQHSSKA